MSPNINVHFDNSSVVYFPGQLISGNVQINSNKYVSARSIGIKFKGYSKVHWTERETTGTGDNRKTETKHYRSEEEYYKAKFILWSDNSHHNQLPGGTHSYNFSFVLPKNIPSSFRSEYGKVQHELEVKIDVPMGFDIRKQFPYSVNDIYDLNRDQQALIPIDKNDHKTVCCFCCKSGPISFVLRIPRSGYVPGEAILINAECTNMSNRLVNDTTVSITQKVIHHAGGKTKKDSRIVASKAHPKIDPGESDIWSGDQLLIPALPPSHLQHCNNINIEYILDFTLSISGTFLDLSTDAPLVIGSIPLQQCFSSFAPAPIMPQQNTSMAGMIAPDAPPPYDYIAPPAGPLPPKIMPGHPMPAPGPPMPAPSAPGPPMPAPGPYMPGQPLPGQPVYGQVMPDPHFPGQPMPPPYNPDYAPHSGIPETSTTLAPSAPVFPGMQEYPNMPPPTYSQCVFGLTKHEDDADDFEYVPRYVSYGLVNPQQNAPGYLATQGAAVYGNHDYGTNDRRRLI